jgi:hypothetical protein
VPEFTITTDPLIFCGEAEKMPSYSLGEKQVAGIKYERGHYYGKVIQSVAKSGHQRTSAEYSVKNGLEKHN